MPTRSRSPRGGYRGPLAVFASVTTLIATTAVTLASLTIRPAPASAQTSGPVLVLLQNGETTAPETPVLQAAGFTVTQVTPATWAGMTATAFDAYAALVIGDPSSGGTCSALTPSTATTGTDAIGANWQQAVTGNLAVIGTAPALAGTAGANALIADAVSYAAAGWSSSAQAGTGLYESLNCEYSTTTTASTVSVLNGVEGTGKTGGLKVQGSLACTDSGTVNTWEAESAQTFGGLTNGQLAAGASGSWPSPACPVQEAFDSWPASFTPVGYDAAGDATDNFTASDGISGQPYLLLGTPVSSASAALAASAGGEVPAHATAGGTANPAAPALMHASTGDPVDTENGDFTQTDDDVDIPAIGPDLGFTRSYDAQLAQQQTQSGTPGPMGYGWTDNWATSLTAGATMPGDIYTIDGLRTNTGNGGLPTLAAMNLPASVHTSGGDTYITDTQGNRIEEIPGASKTQWGISMTAGHEYTIAGSDSGASGDSGNGTLNTRALLSQPGGIALDNAGDLYIADTGNDRVAEIPAASGTQWGTIAMTANDLYTVAGRPGQGALGNDNKPATMSDLASPTQVFIGGNAGGNLYIADTVNNRIQMVSATTQTLWGQAMTANDVYTVAGSAAGTLGSTGDGQNAHTTALLFEPQDMCVSSAGDLYIADTLNSRIQEVPKVTGTEWGTSQTANDMYTIVGNAAGNSGSSANGTAATSARLSSPAGIACPGSTQLYVTDSGDNEIQEVPSAAVTAWGVTMAADKIYTIAGNVAITQGFSGDGGAATSALLDSPEGTVAFDSSGNLDFADTENNEVRQVSKTSFAISDYAGGAGTFDQEGDGGIAVNAALNTPDGIASDAAGDVFVADSNGNRVQEIAASSHTQFGISMTAGNVYTVAGSAGGYFGASGNGGKATSALLNGPVSLAFDAAGNLYIDDDGNCRIQEVSASTANISTVAGNASGNCGNSGDGGPATSALLSNPFAVAADAAGDIFIAGGSTNQVQEVPASTGNGMTKGNIYRIAGSTTGAAGSTGDGGPATSSLLNDPSGVTIDAAGNIYIADASNYRIQEIAGSTHTQFGHALTKGDIYTIAGQTGNFGNSGDGGPATSANLDIVGQLAIDSSGDLYITDLDNNQIREVAVANGAQWGQLMTAGDIYTVAGSTAGTSGSSGDGGPATSALLNQPDGIGVDPAGDLFITDTNDQTLREVTATADTPLAASPVTENPSQGGIVISQPEGAEVTFYPKGTSGCTAPYTLLAGGYCTLPQNVGASLTFSSANGGSYTFSPSPGDTYTYSSSGALQSETDATGQKLTIAYGTPAPGSGNCPAGASTCSTVTSASGRALVIGFNGPGFVTSVTDPMGRAWNYSYSGGDLTSATDPVGNITSYSYGAGSTGNPVLANDLLTIIEPNAQPGGHDAGDATVNVYNAAGQVISQTDPMGNKTTFSYCANAASGNCLNTATGSGLVTITDPDGNTIVDDYVQGTLAAQSSWTGTSLTSEEDFFPDVTAGGTSGGTLLDSATADGNGNITSYQYNAAGVATTVTSPDGVPGETVAVTATVTPLGAASCQSSAEAPSACSQNPGPAPVSPGGAITPPAAPPAGATDTLFDTDGNELYSSTTVNGAAQTGYELYLGNTITLGGTAISCTATPPAPGLPCASISPAGVVTQLGYNAQGDVISSSTPDGNGSQLATTTYSYNADGEQTSTTSPAGNVTGANAANYTTTTAYNADGQETSQTQAGGAGATAPARTTTYGYDADGNQTSVQDARGNTSTTAYNADDQPTLDTNAANDATLTCYDGDGNVAQTVPPVGVAAKTLSPASCPGAYPAGYNPATSQLANDATMTTYDAAGDQTAVYAPAPAGQSGYETTTYRYDGDGQLITTTAPPATSGGSNQVTVDTYTSAGDLATETTGYGTTAAATVSYCYDPNGDQTSVTYPDGNTGGVAPCETSSPWVISASAHPTQAAYQTASTYDSVGDLLSVTTPATTAAPNGGTTSYTYDLLGNVSTSTDPNGVKTTWTYTPDGQPATVSYSGSSAPPVSYGYDAEGQQTSMTDGTGSSSYAYDPFGELTSAVNGAGQTVGYGYDANGNVTGITYPLPTGATWANSNTVTYGYDKAEQLSSVTDFNGNKITVTDTADGLPASAALAATGDTITTTYDNTDTASAIALKNASSTLQSFTYSDAPAGTVLSETDTPGSAQSPAAYGYDSKGRVTSQTPGTGTAVSYGYDASSNLTTLPTGASTSYDHAGELTSSVLGGTTTSYAYDADGNRLSAKQGGNVVTSATWNGDGDLTAYSSPSATMTAATYDSNGMRATASIGSNQNFTWDSQSPLPQLLMDGSNAYIYGSPLAPAEQVSLATGKVTYLNADSVGSVRGLVSNAGALTASTSYDAWGNPQTTGGLTASTPFGYAGGYTDPTGLIYLINRYYDPQTGQFISVDPDLDTSLQPYAYASDNPISDSDPTGLITWFENQGRTNFNINKVRVTNQECAEVGFHFIVDGGGQYCHSDSVVHNAASGHLTVSAQWAYAGGWTYLAWLKGVWSDSDGSFNEPFQLFFIARRGKGITRHSVQKRWFRNERIGNRVTNGNTKWFAAKKTRSHKHPGVLNLHEKNPFLGLDLWALGRDTNRWFRADRTSLTLTTNGK
ncbi:MAG TPA: RHS repeat-associated core domain-containing protein [Streptosporangiaceae bacterium]|nr:RHS repeat-associated core domain-containing protein [Streptosporangiaceae bacterium]